MARCVGRTRGNGWYDSQCPRSATTTGADGKPYCKTHNPELKAAKGKAKEDAWLADLDADAKAYAAREAARKLVEAKAKMLDELLAFLHTNPDNCKIVDLLCAMDAEIEKLEAATK